MNQHLVKPQVGSDVSLARRAGAYAVMSAISALPVFLSLVLFATVGGVVAIVLAPLLVLVMVGVFVWQWRSLAVAGYTIGHRAFGYRIVDVNTGGPLGWGRAFARLLVVGVLAALTCGLGALLLAVLIARDPKKRGLHDQIAQSIAAGLAPLNDPSRPSLLDRVVPASGYAKQARHGQRAPETAWPSANEVDYRRMPPPSPGPRDAGCWVLEIADGEMVEIHGLSLLGRAPTAGDDEHATIVVIADPDRSVSKTHAAIGLAADGRLWVEDRDSTHGVQVRGRDRQRMLMPGSRHTLNAGDIVILGLREITVHLTGR